jgi:hypothetical protein
MIDDCDQPVITPARLGETDLTSVPVFSGLAVEPETWLTVEICVRSGSPQAFQLKEICDEMLARGLPVYVSVSKRGTPYKAG